MNTSHICHRCKQTRPSLLVRRRRISATQPSLHVLIVPNPTSTGKSTLDRLGAPNDARYLAADSTTRTTSYNACEASIDAVAPRRPNLDGRLTPVPHESHHQEFPVAFPTVNQAPCSIRVDNRAAKTHDPICLLMVRYRGWSNWALSRQMWRCPGPS